MVRGGFLVRSLHEERQISLKPYRPAMGRCISAGVRTIYRRVPFRRGHRQYHPMEAINTRVPVGDFMPPIDELRSRVDFIYTDELPKAARTSSGRMSPRKGMGSWKALWGGDKPWKRQ